VKDYERFFERTGELHSENSHSDSMDYVSIEDIYQAFKERFIDETNGMEKATSLELMDRTKGIITKKIMVIECFALP